MTFRSRFRQINILFTVLLLLFLLNVPSGFYRDIAYSPWWALFQRTFFLYGLFLAIFASLSIVRESRLTRGLQVGALLALGAVVVSRIAPRELGGDFIVLLAAALAYKYGIMRTRPRLKSVMFLGVLIGARLFGVFVLHSVEIWRVFNQILITVLAVPILYWVFEAELQQIRRERDRLDALREDNQPFVEFGRNVTGIVHDFKNDVGLFSTFGQFLDLSRGEVLDGSQVDLYHRYVQRLSSRINQIMTVTQASQRYEEATVDLQSLVRSTVYVFQSNLEFKRVIQFELSIPEDAIPVRVSPAPLVSILENLMRNSCEALVEHPPADGAPELAVTVRTSTRGVEILIVDNGPGLPFCSRCREENCLYCPEIATGMTTKDNGSGIGLVSIRRHAERYQLHVMLRSAPDAGVAATVTIGADRIAAAADDRPSDMAIGVDA